MVSALSLKLSASSKGVVDSGLLFNAVPRTLLHISATPRVPIVATNRANNALGLQIMNMFIFECTQTGFCYCFRGEIFLLNCWSVPCREWRPDFQKKLNKKGISQHVSYDHN